MEIEIKKLSAQDLNTFTDLIKVFEVVFEMEELRMPDNNHLQGLLNKENFLVFVATADAIVVGGLTVYVLDQYYSSKPQAYIYDLAVLAECQRKGIGKKLIASVTSYCRQNGFGEAFVQAETEDTHAVNFYRTTPISSELQATHFTYSF